MESPEAAEGRRGGDERGARWGKEECGYGRSRTSPSRTGPAKPDRDHEKRAKRRPRGPTACARASAPHLCSRHSPNRCLRGFPARFPARVSPVRRERFLLSSGENVFLLFRISSLLSSSSRDLASSTDGILIGSRIGQSSERNELVGTKRSCLKIARGDYCFFFFSFFLFSFHRWWQWWWWSTKLENFLANKFNIVKKKSVRINEYRFLANKFGILAKKDRKQYFTEASSRFFLSLKHGIFQDQLSLKNIQGAWLLGCTSYKKSNL